MHNSELFKLKAELCKTFADAKGLVIINELRNGEKLVGELAQSLNIPHAVASRHLALLRNRGVVRPRHLRPQNSGTSGHLFALMQS